MEIAAGGPCPLCNAALTARTLSAIAGEEAQVRIVLRELPVLSCDAPHRYFVGHKFPIWLLNTLVDRELAKIPAGRRRGMLFAKYACGLCGAGLAGQPGATATHTASLAWKETPAFSADIVYPVHRCTACGKIQARSAEELAKLLPAALVHAFKAAGLKAPG